MTLKEIDAILLHMKKILFILEKICQMMEKDKEENNGTP